MKYVKCQESEYQQVINKCFFTTKNRDSFGNASLFLKEKTINHSTI